MDINDATRWHVHMHRYAASHRAGISCWEFTRNKPSSINANPLLGSQLFLQAAHIYTLQAAEIFCARLGEARAGYGRGAAAETLQSLQRTI